MGFGTNWPTEPRFQTMSGKLAGRFSEGQGQNQGGGGGEKPNYTRDSEMTSEGTKNPALHGTSEYKQPAFKGNRV